MLESQAVRPATRRAYMSRRPRRKPRFAMFAAVIAVTASGWAGWKLLGSTPRVPAADAASAAVRDSAPVSPAPAKPFASLKRPDAIASAAKQARPGPGAGSGTQAPRTAPKQQTAAPAAPIDVVSTPEPQEPPQQLLLERPAPAGGESQQPLAREVVASLSPSPAPAPASASAPAPVPIGASFADTQRTPSGDPVTVRRELTIAMLARGTSPGEQARLRRIVADLSERLVFGPEVVPGDPYALAHVVESGEQLLQIVKREAVMVDWRFVRRINRITNERNVRVGQALKLIRGPFHAEVSKRDHRLDLYLGDGSSRVYVRSFSVGLGELNSTPTGLFRIRPASKMPNPAWVNPRTRQQYEPDDPANPIGEYWLGLEGIEDHNRSLDGYGIHGTIEPESIGTDASMGCIRMLPQDVEIIYEMLVEGDSTVFIQP